LACAAAAGWATKRSDAATKPLVPKLMKQASTMLDKRLLILGIFILFSIE
jgi:hypothetical protein